MTYTPITPKEVLDYLLNLSQELKTELTIEKVREVLELDKTAGASSFELIIPELKFRKYYYKTKAYIRITPDYSKLKINIERKDEEQR